jgi:zinc protease
MNLNKIIPGLLLGCCFGSIAATAQKGGAPVKVTEVEGITEYRLPNGLRVLLFPDQSKPTITVNATYMVGSRMEGYGETGMAHLLEHMLFKGSTKHPHIPDELTAHGASPNGSTSYDRTNYFETFSATDENLNWGLNLEADRMINSFIAEKDLKSEFSVVRNEFESGENSPQNILEERVLSTMYIWHNYGKSTIGSKEDIEKVPIKNLQAFYKKYYQPDNAVLLVAGKIDAVSPDQAV